MSVNKKNNWLKLKVDFFSTPQLKKLRKIAGGDKYLIIYQKLMLLTVNSEGHYEFQNLEPTLEEELALILDEDVDNLRMLISFLKLTNQMQTIDLNNIFFVEVPKLIGRYDNSSERVAKYRALRQQEKKCNTLQSCYNDVTCNDVTLLEKEIEIDIEKEYLPPTPYEGGDKKTQVVKKQPEQGHNIFDIREVSEEEQQIVRKAAFRNWQQIATELEVEFTESEWNQIKGYIISNPRLPIDEIKARVMLLDKWANEGLDIIDCLLQCRSYKTLIKPKMSTAYDDRDNRIYGQQIVEKRRRTIQKEKEGKLAT